MKDNRNISFRISIWRPIYIINSVDRTKLYCNTRKALREQKLGTRDSLMNDRLFSVGFVDVVSNNLASSSVTELNVRSYSNRPSH